uniref:ABC transporter domain-containing protein n=1 Tax=Ditylenchus dipsaci TaxID=166011 RepID=A0A915EDA3_9BILA
MQFMWNIESAKSKTQDGVVLEKINGMAAAGEVYAILGSSGSGSEMMLDALTKLQVDLCGEANFWIDLKQVTRETFAGSFDAVPSTDLSESHQSVYDFLLDVKCNKEPETHAKKEEVEMVVKMLGLELMAAQLVSELSEDLRKCLKILSTVLACRKALYIEGSCLQITSPIVADKLFKTLIPLAKLKNILVLMPVSLSKAYHTAFEMIEKGTLLDGGKILCQGGLNGLNMIYDRLTHVYGNKLDARFPLRTLFNIFGSEMQRNGDRFGILLRSSRMSIRKMFDMDSQPQFRFYEDDNPMCATVLSIFESGFTSKDITIKIGENRKEIIFHGDRKGSEPKRDYGVVVIPHHLQFDRWEWYDGNSDLLILFASINPNVDVPIEMLQLKSVKE